MSNSKISWTDRTWNPVSGCAGERISPGCDHCYAAREANHLLVMGNPKYEKGFRVQMHPGELDKPYHWKKPQKVFVPSMGDLFHRQIPLSYIKRVWKVMNDNPHLTFQVLTKRIERAEELSSELNWTQNIWMGCTVESNQYYHRIAHLRRIPAAIRFISVEPMLSPVSDIDLTGVDWCICGGESGSGFREMKKEWALELRDICKRKGVAFFFKQWSGFHPRQLGCELAGWEYKELPKPSIPTWTQSYTHYVVS